jgi:hypothetical protein
MPLGNEGPDKKHPCDWDFDLVQHRIEMCAGNGKVSGALG